MDIKQILRDNGFRFNKQFGQNFLTDNLLLQEIADDAGIANGTVLEIGAGAGTLTRVLCQNAKKVVAFEIDRRLKKILDLTLAEFNNVDVVIGDIMRYKMSDVENMCGGSYAVVANIPYYITTPLLMNFIENAKGVTALTLTIQKEVAERLVAKAGTKQYGAITVAVDAVADAQITRVLPRQLFYPQPNVDSAVVKIVLRRGKYDIPDGDMFRKTVKCAFAMRRKTLVNNLAVGFGLEKSAAERILESCGLPIGCRGEELTTLQLVELSKALRDRAK